MSKKRVECHGKIEDGEITMLEQVWGFNEFAKYGTKDEEEYRRQVMEMNRTDLEKHARKVGVIIVESSARLQESLFKAFRQYSGSLSRPKQPKQSKTSLSKEVRKILAEGK